MSIKPLGLPPDWHAQQIEAHFGGFGRAQFVLPTGRRYLFVCFTNRSGSNYLAELLAGTEVFNRAEERFTWDHVSYPSKDGHVDSFEDYIGRTVGWASRGDWFAVKAAAGQLELLARVGFFAAIQAVPSFIIIHRADKLGQAISFAIAEQTGRWTSDTPAALATAAVYNRRRIDHFRSTITAMSTELEQFLAVNNITPLRIGYEDFVASPQTELDRVSKWLGIGSLTARPERVSITRQRDATNEAWRNRYLAGE